MCDQTQMFVTSIIKLSKVHHPNSYLENLIFDKNSYQTKKRTPGSFCCKSHPISSVQFLVTPNWVEDMNLVSVLHWATINTAIHPGEYLEDGHNPQMGKVLGEVNGH